MPQNTRPRRDATPQNNTMTNNGVGDGSKVCYVILEYNRTNRSEEGKNKTFNENQFVVPISVCL